MRRPTAAKLKALVEAGQYTQAEAVAKAYYKAYTDVVEKWTTDPGLELSLRDCVFNRGPQGAIEILQRALGFHALDVDGHWGPQTYEALTAAVSDPERLIRKIRTAREAYEHSKGGIRENLEKGLEHRWDDCEKKSLEMTLAVPGPDMAYDYRKEIGVVTDTLPLTGQLKDEAMSILNIEWNAIWTYLLEQIAQAERTWKSGEGPKKLEAVVASLLASIQPAIADLPWYARGIVSSAIGRVVSEVVTQLEAQIGGKNWLELAEKAEGSLVAWVSKQFNHDLLAPTKAQP